MRREHHDVVFAHLHVLVLVRGHERERTHRLTLRSGADHTHFAGCVPRRFVDVDDLIGRNAEQAHLAAERDVVHHGTSEERDLAPRGDGLARNLLHPVQVGRK